LGAIVFRGRDRAASSPLAVEACPPEARSRFPAAADLLANQWDEARLRQAIREEVSAALAVKQPSAPSPAHDPATSPQTAEVATSDESVRAYERARSTIDAAIARGSWVPADRLQMRATLPLLPQAQRDELMNAIDSAIETKKVDHHGPVF